MKRYISIIFFFLMGMISGAQQLTTSSLYEMQGILHNPSITGVRKHGVLGVSFRTMWDGIPGGPKTAFLFGSGYLEKAKIGMGGYFYSDITGPTKRIGVQMAYAYHIPINNMGIFSIGLEGRFLQFSFDQNKLQQSLGNDPVLSNTDTRFKGDAGMGVSYTNKKFQAGASVSQLIQSKLNFYSGNLSGTEDGKLYRHYYLHSNYTWDGDGTVSIIPNFLIIYLPNTPLEFQGGARVELRDLLWWGLALRARQSWMLSAGIHIKKKFSVGYSFDIFSTPLSIYDKSSHTHELMLRYDFLK